MWSTGVKLTEIFTIFILALSVPNWPPSSGRLLELTEWQKSDKITPVHYVMRDTSNVCDMGDIV